MFISNRLFLHNRVILFYAVLIVLCFFPVWCLGTGCGIPLYRFLISAFTFSFQVEKDTNVKWKRNTRFYSYTNCVAISSITHTTILCKINLAIVFNASDPSYHAFILILLHQDTSADHQRRISRKTNQEWSIATFVLGWRQFLRPADVKLIFDDMRKPMPYWSECLVTKINKKKNKTKNSCWKHLNRLREIRLQIVKIWRFSCFYNIVLKQRF